MSKRVFAQWCNKRLWRPKKSSTKLKNVAFCNETFRLICLFEVSTPLEQAYKINLSLKIKFLPGNCSSIYRNVRSRRTASSNPYFIEYPNSDVKLIGNVYWVHRQRVKLPRVRWHRVKQHRIKRHRVKQETVANTTKGQNGKKYFMYYFRVRFG